MARSKKIRKEAVYSYLCDNQWHTISSMSIEFDVNPDTIRQRLRELVSDQVSLIVGQNGYRLVKPANVKTQEDAREVERMLRWIIQSVSRLALNGKSMKQLAQVASKFLPKNEGERARLRSSFVKLTHLIDWQDSDIL